MNTMILNLLMKYNHISMSQMQVFHTLNTISKVLFDFNKYKKNYKKQFCEKYGHRPQSYSIESKSYNEAFDDIL